MAATPDRLAVKDDTHTFSFADLDRISNTVAVTLLRAGVQREQPVCVCMPRSALWVAALLGVLRAGAAYVPLDPDYAHARLQVRKFCFVVISCFDSRILFFVCAVHDQ